jgi:glycosyltransferase involved in cell wall biosynthesis
MKNILWLVSWYPNALSPYDGDFIQRHARAVALFQKLTVIYVKKDERGSITKNIKIVSSSERNLTEIIVYYHVPSTKFQLLNKIYSVIKYKNVYRNILKKYISQNGKPDLVHVHVALKAGVNALWLKKKFNIPFIVSEHWSGYLPGAKNGVKNLSLIQKKLLGRILNEAKKNTVVSDELGKAIKKQFELNEYTVVQNVVDTDVFFPMLKIKNNVVQFIHISSLDYKKNIPAIIEAFNLVRKKGYEFRFVIIGPGKQDVIELIEMKSLSKFIEYKNEVPQTELASYLRVSDALILYSHYETFGCVVIEANACGVPAILSDLPVFKEYITENENGILVNTDNPVALADAIENFILAKYTFDNKSIGKKTAEKFNYDRIGRQFCQVYENVLTS